MKGKFSIGNFVNMPTNNESDNKIHINIHDIRNNPMNFYRVKDIEALAQRLTFAPDMDRISVFEDGDKYMLCSGHKRVAALLYGLENGYEFSTSIIQDGMIEVTLKDFEKEERTFGKGIFTKEDFRVLDIILPNKGQRRDLSIAEEAKEVEYLEPIFHKVYDNKKNQGELSGVKWRTYFAEIMEMSETRLQRFIDYRKLSPEVKEGIDKGLIKFTVVVDELSHLPEEDQQSIFSALKEKQGEGEEITGKSVKAEKKAKISPKSKEEKSKKITEPTEKIANVEAKENLAQLEAEGQIRLPEAESVDSDLLEIHELNIPDEFGKLTILLSKKEEGYIAGFRFEYMDQPSSQVPDETDIAKASKEEVIQDEIFFLAEYGSYQIKRALYEGGYIKTAPKEAHEESTPQPFVSQEAEAGEKQTVDALKKKICSFIVRLENVNEKEKIKKELEELQTLINDSLDHL